MARPVEFEYDPAAQAVQIDGPDNMGGKCNY